MGKKHGIISLIIGLLALVLLPMHGLAVTEPGAAAADKRETIEDEDIPQTGLEIRNDGSWTTHEEELDFLEEVSQKSDRMEYTVHGYSAEGRPLHLVRVSNPGPGTDEEIADGRNILIVGTFHGNEPSGREMSLKLLRDLSFTDDPDLLELMENSTILFIPTMNPDGREANVRRNVDDFDLNRDHLALKTPEVQTLASVQQEFKPDIILDAHERISGPNISLLGNLNLNVDSELRELNDELFEDFMFPDLEDAGFTVDYYPPGARPTNTRSMSGLRHSIGILTEGSWTDEPLVRVAGQMESAYSILRFYHEKFDRVGEVVSASRENKMREGEERNKPFYLSGMVGDLPEDESDILDPPPCGYLINEMQKEYLETQIDLFGLEIEEVENGYFVSMAQPMMTVIPFMLDENSEIKLANGLAVDHCEDIGKLDPPSMPEAEVFETDFANDEAGQAPAGFENIWGDSSWTIKEDPKRLEHFVTDGGDRRLLVWDEIGEVHGDVEAAALVRANNEGELFELHLHGSGSVGNETSYYLDVTKQHDENSIRISRLMGGRNTTLATEDLDFELEVDQWYQVVFQRDGNALKGKVWPYEEPEPEEWVITFEDDMYIDLGRVGVGHSTTGMINDWKYLSVGTYGESAERAPDDLIEGVDKSVLERRINEIADEDLNEEDFLPDSWENLQQAINAAVNVLHDEEATQSEVNHAVDTLYNAYASLAAQYSTNFSEYEAGQAPSNWSTLWRESGWTVKDDPSRLEHFVTEGGGRRVLTWDKAGDITGDVELSALVKANPGNTMFQIHLQGSGNAGGENSYYLDLRSSGNVRINRNMNGGFTVLQSSSIPFTPEGNQWYQVVFQRDGTTLKGKVWPYGEEEPEDWQVEVNDSNFIQGKVGVGHVSSGVTNEWAYFAVGTNEAEAVRAPDNLIIDKSPLEDKIIEIESKNLSEENFTDDTWSNLQNAISSAEELLEESDLTQEQILEEIQKLDDAFGQLQTISKQLANDFSDYETGEVPSDWSMLWRESGWTVKDNPSRLEHFVTSGGGRRVLTWDEADTVYGDVEISGLVRNTTDNGVLFQLHLLGSGDAGSESSYYLDVTRSGNVRINRNREAYFDVLQSESFPYEVRTNSWYQAVLKKEGTTLKGKVWPYGEEEPADWQVEVDDASFQNGKVGVGHVTSGANNEWAYFAAGTNDAEAPRAEEGLVADKSPLADKLDEMKSKDLHEGDFTGNSWGMLQNAINNAEDVLEASEVTQLEILGALQALDNAYEALQTVSKQMATDFSGYVTGEAPSDWSMLWRESGWTVKDDPSRLEHYVTEGGGRRVLTWDEAETVYGDVEVAAVVRARDYAASMFQLHLQGSGSAGSENSYYIDLRNDRVRINRNMDAYFDSLGAVEFPYTAEANDWLQVVLKKEGSKLKGKIWPYGEEEPAGWQIEVEDNNFNKGKVGVGHVTSGATNDWAYFAVGTNDAAAPRPPADLFDPEVDKTALQDRVDEIQAEGLNEEDYTEESWQALQAALTAAEELLNDPDATQEEVDIALTELNEARDGLEEAVTEPISAAGMITSIEAFDEEGAFENDQAVRSLTTHLTAVDQYESQEEGEKVVKHMDSFILLLEHMKEEEQISEEAYESLYTDAESLIAKWE